MVFLDQDALSPNSSARLITRVLNSHDLTVNGWRRFRLMSRRWCEPARQRRTADRAGCSRRSRPSGLTKKLERAACLCPPNHRARPSGSRFGTLYIAQPVTRTIALQGHGHGPNTWPTSMPDLADSRLKSSAVVFHQRFSHQDTLPALASWPSRFVCWLTTARSTPSAVIATGPSPEEGCWPAAT